MTARPYDVITFDCYGTLIDWDGGLSAAFRAEGHRHGIDLAEAAILHAYHHAEPGVQSEAYRPYREVLGEVAARCAPALGLPEDGPHTFLAESLPSWRPFPDTNAALTRLQEAGYELGILSNIDDDLFAATSKHFPVPFDPVITAQRVRSYKPGHAHFEAAREVVGTRRWLHAAQSYYHDVVPARALGIPVVWVNRQAEAPGGDARPDGEVGTLDELVTWLAAAT